MNTQTTPGIKEELAGIISLKFNEGKKLDDFCMANIDNYEPDRFDPVAVRLFYGKELIVTVYALDKFRQEQENSNPDKLPVKKFKLTNISFQKALELVSEFNFTLQTGGYELDEIEVINK